MKDNNNNKKNSKDKQTNKKRREIYAVVNVVDDDDVDDGQNAWKIRNDDDVFFLKTRFRSLFSKYFNQKKRKRKKICFSLSKFA